MWGCNSSYGWNFGGFLAIFTLVIFFFWYLLACRWLFVWKLWKRNWSNQIRAQFICFIDLFKKIHSDFVQFNNKFAHPNERTVNWYTIYCCTRASAQHHTIFHSLEYVIERTHSIKWIESVHYEFDVSMLWAEYDVWLWCEWDIIN